MKYFMSLLLAITILIFALAPAALPHGGEDHSGASLTGEKGTTPGRHIKISKKAQFILEIITARAVERSVPRRHKMLGRVVLPPQNKAVIHSPFPGLIEPTSNLSLPFPGQRVKKGEVLVYVEQVVGVRESVSLDTEIIDIESKRKQAEKELALAEWEVKRVNELGDAISHKRHAEAHAAAAIAKEKLEGLTSTVKRLRTAQSNMADSPRMVAIKAPLTGVITSSHATIGEFVSPEKMLYEIMDNSIVWIEVDVFEMEFTLVEEADRAEIITEAYPGKIFKGKIQYIGQKLHSQSRTVKAYFTVANPKGQLREGMFIQAFVESKNKVKGVMFPKSALLNVGDQKIVYVKTSPETFIAKAVELKGVWGNQVIVGSGVEPGDLVVIQGTYQVKTSGLK